MKKQNYSTPAIILIDMKTYGIMDIQGESKFSINGQDPTQIIDGNPEGDIDAKSYNFDLWADDDLSEDDF